MEDYTHLRKTHKEDEGETLLAETEMNAVESLQCLNEMKHISHLISKVTFLLLFRLMNF